MRSTGLAVVLLAAAISPLSNARAADVQWAAELGAAHSNNIDAAQPGNERGEDIGQANLQLAVTETSRRLNADLSADFSYIDYLKGTYDSEFVGGLLGHVDIELVPERARWLTTDSFGETRDPLSAPSPANRENINFLTTGPDVAFNITERSQVVLGGRYSRVDYETSPLNSQRYLGSLALLRNFSASSGVSLQGSTERVDFAHRGAFISEYDRRQASISYSLNSSRNVLSLSAGYNRIELAGSGASGGPLLNLALNHQISSRSEFGIEVGQQLTDSGAGFGAASQTESVSLDAQPVSRSADPFQDRHVSLYWEAVGRRTRIGASASYYQERYVRQILSDLNRTSGDVHLYRSLSQFLGFRLTAAISKADYLNNAGDSQESTYDAGLAFRTGRRLTVDASVQQFHRTSDLATGTTSGTRIWLRIRLGQQFVPGVGPFGRRFGTSNTARARMAVPVDGG